MKKRTAILVILAGLLLVAAGSTTRAVASPRPRIADFCPPLPPPTGQTVTVATEAELRDQAYNAAAERARLRALLQDFRLAVAGHRPLAEAMVTAGGVDTRQVDPTTMASRLVKGLYFAGELLDVQADTGGFNLQAAFSTG